MIMKTTLFLENQTAFPHTSNMDLAALSYPKVLQLETMINKIDKKDAELFCRIVEAVKINDLSLSEMLAFELTKIRILKRNLLVTVELIHRYRTKYIN